MLGGTLLSPIVPFHKSPGQGTGQHCISVDISHLWGPTFIMETTLNHFELKTFKQHENTLEIYYHSFVMS